MIFLPPHYRARARSIVFLAGPLHLRHSFRTGFSSLSHFSPSPSHPFDSLSPRGGNPGFNPFPYNFLPMHREKLARNTHAHARTLGGPLLQHPSPPALFHALARSLARPLVGGHRLLDFIEFSSSARRHPVQTRIRQLTPLACGGSAIKPAVREVRSTARTAPARFFGATRIRDAAPSKFRC